MTVAPLTPKQILSPLNEHRRLITCALIVGVLIGVAHYLVARPRFEARLLVLPSLQGESSILGMAGDIAQLTGINIGSKTDATLLYRDIMTSDMILDRLLNLKVDPDGPMVGSSFGNLETLEDRERAVRQLRKSISVNRDSRARSVEVRVQSTSRELASALADSLGGALDAYLGASRRQDSAAQFDFLRVEADNVTKTLDGLESRLAEFQTRNRMIAQSPELQREEAMLRRDILIKEAVLVEVMKQVELTAMGMRRDVPVIRVLEPARTYRRPVYPRLSHSLLMSVGLMTFLVLAFVYIKHSIDGSLQNHNNVNHLS